MISHSDDHNSIQGSISLAVARLRRCRFVFPLEAGIGQAPQSLAKAASERMRSGLSATRMSISAAVPVEIPWASSMAGAQNSVKASSSAS